MAEDRVQEALAAHLEHLEVGGPPPDTSHLTPEERERLESLIRLLDSTEGIAFGRGLDERVAEVATASTETGERLLAAMRDALPGAVRIANDPAAAMMPTLDVPVVEGWTVGTFGGRIRAWLFDRDGGLDQLSGLERVFRILPETAALALVDRNLACLLVRPEDCAPAIEVPRGSIVPRRYRRPVQPAGEALAAFVRELTPVWEPTASIAEPAAAPRIDTAPLARELARRAVEAQAAAGARARKTNPKRTALTALGGREAGAVADLVAAVHEGRIGLDEVEQTLRELARDR